MVLRGRLAHAAPLAALATVGILLTACGDLAPPSAAPPTAAAQTSPSPSPNTPPPLNALETRVVEALAMLGITGERAELPFNNAAIWAHGSGWELHVNAARAGTTRPEFTVVDERRLEGVRVQRVQYASGPPPRYRFECATDTYEVSGGVPPGFADMDALVGRFIRALGCAA